MLELYKRIKNRREELKMTQDALAKKVGYKSRTSIHKIELGRTDLPQSKIMEFADALATTPEYLMGWTAEVSKRVSEDEAELVDGYRALNDVGKQLVKGLVMQMNRDSSPNIERRGVTQNNKNGNNYYGITGGNFSSNVTV